MRERGLLGDDILGSGFSCDIEVKEIAGSLVAGEETALLRALEGRQPLPYLRPGLSRREGPARLPTLIDQRRDPRQRVRHPPEASGASARAHRHQRRAPGRRSSPSAAA